MKTDISLMMKYGSAVVPLERVAADYLGLGRDKALAEWHTGRLPFPAWRARDSQKAPVLVNVADLADYLDAQRNEAVASLEQIAPEVFGGDS